jgi:hypothetical protein
MLLLRCASASLPALIITVLPQIVRQTARYAGLSQTLWYSCLFSDGAWLFGEEELIVTTLKVYILQDLLRIMLKGKHAVSAIDKLGCFKLSRVSFLQRTTPFLLRVNSFSTSDDVSSIYLKIEYQNMADGLLRGDRVCLARLITLIESQRRKLQLLHSTAFSVSKASVR